MNAIQFFVTVARAIDEKIRRFCRKVKSIFRVIFCMLEEVFSLTKHASRCFSHSFFPDSIKENIGFTSLPVLMPGNIMKDARCSSNQCLSGNGVEGMKPQVNCCVDLTPRHILLCQRDFIAIHACAYRAVSWLRRLACQFPLSERSSLDVPGFAFSQTGLALLSVAIP